MKLNVKRSGRAALLRCGRDTLLRVHVPGRAALPRGRFPGRAALPRGLDAEHRVPTNDHLDAEHRVPTDDNGRAAARPYLLSALRSTLLSLLPLLLAVGCVYPTARVLEVSSRTRLQDIDLADQRVLLYDPASRLAYDPKYLPIDQQREEFYVRWAPGWTPESGPGPVTAVKFEYQQLEKPNAVKVQTFVPAPALSPPNENSSEPTFRANPSRTCAHLFEVHGEEFRAGGPVSAWRVSLWDGDRLLAEKKSLLW